MFLEFTYLCSHTGPDVTWFMTEPSCSVLESSTRGSGDQNTRSQGKLVKTISSRVRIFVQRYELVIQLFEIEANPSKIRSRVTLPFLDQNSPTPSPCVTPRHAHDIGPFELILPKNSLQALILCILALLATRLLTNDLIPIGRCLWTELFHCFESEQTIQYGVPNSGHHPNWWSPVQRGVLSISAAN